MKVRKIRSTTNPGYPNTRQFLAALGVGAFAAAAQAEPIPLGGVPPPPKQAAATADESRLLGDIAVVPVQLPGGIRAVSTNRVAAAPSNTVSYTVQKGDTLTGIARTQLGNAARAKDIVSLNPGIDPEALAIGAVLLLPVKAAGEAVPVPKGVMPPPRLQGKPASPR